MSRFLIVKGDHTTHGGTVVEGHANAVIAEKPIATVGMAVMCPMHGRTTIVSGQSNIQIDGKAAAVHGDKTSCGATLLSSQSLAALA